MPRGRRPATDFDARLGAELRRRRLELGLTMKQIGQPLGCSEHQTSKYEKGIDRLRVELFASLCRLYGASADDLLGIAGSGAPTNGHGNVRTIRALLSLKPPIREPVAAMIRALAKESAS